MAKFHSQYVCQQCGYAQVGWSGRCPECQSWGSLVETVTREEKGSESKPGNKKSAKPVTLDSIPVKSTVRISTKISELDRVLGGGLVPGQVVLIAGEPGIGKSTILLQVASQIGETLYVSGEESSGQIKLRAERLGIKGKSIGLLEETDVDLIIENADTNPDVHGSKNPLKAIIIDSIQTMITTDLSGMAGSVGQVRECASRLVRLAKSTNIPIFIVGHVTKQGSVAGPSVLMHIVDTVLWFEGDKTLPVRVIRAVKNRFGATDEVGIFSMEEKGLVSMDSPEKIFLSETKNNLPGTVITSVMEGSRPLLIEVQSLVVPTKMAYPKRIAQGMDTKRFELLLAILQRRCNIPFYEFDAFVNIAGGISIKNDPSADLAVCLSLASSYFDKALPKGSIAIGEVGLLGDVREVVALDKRVKEASRLGYRIPITSKAIKYLQEGIRKYLK